MPKGDQTKMRYREIIEAQSAAEKLAKESEKQRKANQQRDNARRKRMEAGRKYQDDLRSASEAEQNAQAKLRKP
jgi:hypothetical protein